MQHESSIISTRGLYSGLIVLLVAAFSSHFLTIHDISSEGRDIQLEKIPYSLAGWSGVDSDKLPSRSQDILKLDSYVRRVYTNQTGESVFLYIGYWKKQSGEHQAAKHSPLMCLPANGWKIGIPEEVVTEFKESDGSRLQVSKLLAENRGESTLFYYWFFSGQKNYRFESEALFHIIRQTLLHGRSDGGIVEISTVAESPNTAASRPYTASSTLNKFLLDFYPALRALLDDKHIENSR